MIRPEDRTRYLHEAERCRRQAENVAWPDIREQLKQLAREYELLAHGGRPPSPSHAPGD
jgi:hypothetical protein